MIAPFSDPERWLEQIRQLRKENKQTEADREWRRFREAFPIIQSAKWMPLARRETGVRA